MSEQGNTGERKKDHALVQLREVEEDDLEVFFANERDPAGRFMAAFTSENPDDREAFAAHWAKIRADAGILIRTILYEGQIAGSVLSHSWFGEPEVSYWIGREFWGKGIATAALRAFLELQTTRPLYARVVHDNVGSIRVLEKCGFVQTGRDEGYAASRGAVVKEFVFQLD